MSTVTVYTNTHSVTYLADQILKGLKDIIRMVGLDPTNFVNEWDLNMRGLKAWLESGHLNAATLEIFNPSTDELITRWDMDIDYSSDVENQAYWADAEQIRYAINKAGLVPSAAKYRLVLQTASNRPNVAGWGSTTYRSTAGMVRQSVGTTIQHGSLSGSLSYLRKP